MRLVNDFTPTTIEVEGKTVTARATQAHMGIVTRVWAPKRWGPFLRKHWDYGPEHSFASLQVNIEVDDTSGDDCALYPTLRIVFRPGGWTANSFADLAGQTFVEGEDPVEFECWYGNDAPHFENNRVTFQRGDEADQLHVDWSAQFRWDKNDKLQPFRFSGLIRIQGLWIAVMRDKDVAPIVAATMPGFDLGSLNAPEITDEDHRPHSPKKFAHWRVHWFAA
ncbi:MAG: hypothetical protein AAF697_09535 [Pseudomonadota bacterium]